MKRKYPILFVVILIAVAGVSMIVESQTEEIPVYVHFLVAPSVLPDGSSSDAELQNLKEFLLQTAGGYTAIGDVEGGYLDSQGTAVIETNYSIMVSASSDLSVQIRDFLVEHFSTSFPYVIVWQANMADPQIASFVPLWQAEKK